MNNLAPHSPLARLIERLPDSADEILAYVRSLCHQDQESEAAALLKAAIERSPQGSFYVALGTLYMQQARYKDALVYLIEVLRSRPDHHPTILLVAECLIHCDEHERAQNMLKQAERAGAPQPKLQNLRKLLLHKKLGTPAPPSPTLKADPLAPSQSALMQNPLHTQEDAPTYSMARPSFAAPQPKRAAAAESQDEHTVITELPNFDDFEATSLDLVAPPQLKLPEDTIDEHAAFGRPSFPPMAIPAPPPGFTPHRYEEEDDSPTKAFESPYARGAQPPASNQQRAGQSWADANSEEDAFWTSAQTPGLSGPSWADASLDHAPSQPARPPLNAPHALPADMRDDGDERGGYGIGYDEPAATHEDIFGLNDVESYAPTPSIPSKDKLPPGPPKPALKPIPNIPPSGEKPLPPRPHPHNQAAQQPQQPAPLELELDDQPPARRIARHHATERHATADQGDKAAATTKKLGAGALAIMLALAIGGYATVYLADQGVASKIEADVNAARQNIESDSFEQVSAALKLLDQAKAHESFLGRAWDERIAKTLPSLPGLHAQRSRRWAVGLAAKHSAIAEHRFLSVDALGSLKKLDEASHILGQDHPDVLLGKLYQELLTQPVKSVTLAEGLSRSYAHDLDIQGVYVLALLQAGLFERAYERAQPLRKAGAPSIYQLIIAATASERYAKPQEARQLYERIISGYKGQQVEAKAALAALPLPDQGAAATATGYGPGELKSMLASDHTGLAPNQLATIHLRLGQLMLDRDELDRALDHYKLAATLATARGDLSLPLVDLLIQTGDYVEALRLIKLIQSMNQLEPLVQLRLAKIDRLKGQYDAALERLNKLDEGMPERHLELAQLYLERRQWASAHKAADAAERLDTSQGRAQILKLLAEQQQEHDRTDKISEAMKRLLDRQDSSAWVALGAARADAALAVDATKAKTKQDLIASAQRHLTEAKRLNPYSAQLELTSCQVEAMRNKLPQALERCANAQRFAPQWPPVILQRADLLLQSGKAAEAQELLSQAREALPKHAHISMLLARAYTMMGMYKDAQAELDRWLGDPLAEQASYKSEQGMLAFYKEDLGAALGYLKQAVELEPGLVEAQIFLAYTRVRFGELKEAEKPLREHLDHPRFGGYAWLALGELRRRQRRFQDAEENLAKAISTLKSDAAPSNMIAQAYIQRALAWQDKYGWANPRVKTYLEAAAAQDAQSVELHYLLGLRELNQRKPELNLALTHFERALALSPEHCMSLRSLDYIYKQQRQDQQVKANAKRIEQASCAP